MTDLALDREQQVTVNSSKFIMSLILLILMAIGLAGSVMLLNWAVDTKLAKSEVAESSQITADMRERQLGCLARNIYYEAGGEPFEGKVAVAQVTMNRVNSGQFPDDVCRTVYQKNVIYDKVICQFSWVCQRESGVKPANKVAYGESMEVAKKVLLEGFRLPSLTNAKYFHATRINPGWNRKRVATIGGHVFYE